MLKLVPLDLAAINQLTIDASTYPACLTKRLVSFGQIFLVAHALSQIIHF
jgi:hypothetical protein